jgi:hypothetical protein
MVSQLQNPLLSPISYHESLITVYKTVELNFLFVSLKKQSTHNWQVTQRQSKAAVFVERNAQLEITEYCFFSFF